MKLKTGKTEIVYLLTKVLEKYEFETGQKIIRNSNRKNYDEIGKILSHISNELPNTAEQLQHDHYSPDYNHKKLDYPLRKYDITGNQIKDAYYNGIVSNPRNFLVDACYIYLYGVGRKGFELNPLHEDLIENNAAAPSIKIETDAEERSMTDEMEGKSKGEEKHPQLTKPPNSKKLLLSIIGVAIAIIVFLSFKWISTENKWRSFKADMNILPYQPTKAEIDSLEGIWLCYTGSPQARSSENNRYHMVVSNVVEVKYKNGYFVFTRYGASFNHIGYMQFESPGIVSIHSYLKNTLGIVESPRHSLMHFDKNEEALNVISASWSFDIANRNEIIGIREVYIKQGKTGDVQEVINTIENASCHCKIVSWKMGNGTVKNFYLKNELLDTLPNRKLQNLLNEKSIILRVPREGLILSSDSLIKK